MFFLWILLAIIIFCIMIVFSTIKIEIENLKIALPKEDGRHINKDYKITIKLYILKKIKILNLKITKTMMERKTINEQMKKLEKKMIKDRNNFDVKFLDVLKILKIKIEAFRLKLDLGTENAAFTAILVGLISGILGFTLGRVSNNLNNIKFETIPIYQDKNLLKIDFNGIFSLKMIHIIYIIYILSKKKRRVDKNVRTSNRRAYAYSNG